MEADGINAGFDDSGKRTGSNSGNLIARIEGAGRHIMFIAHMDTVETGSEAVRPIVSNGKIYTDGSTILGADNKSAIAALLEAMHAMKGMKNMPGVTAVFSTGEEEGEMGAKHLDINGIDYAFVIEGIGKPGIFVNKILGHAQFEVEIMGRATHAAKEPEKGRNAIKAAALAISKFRLGRRSNGDTLNVGAISGGTFTNVVPAKAAFTGEVRSFNRLNMENMLRRTEAVVAECCRITHCKYAFKIKSNEIVDPFSVSQRSRIFNIAKAAAKAGGMRFEAEKLYATTEANVLAKKGVETICMFGGGAAPHSVSESLLVEDMVRLKSLIVAVAKSANKY